ncbi:hypothetical protein A4G20_07250 [Pasteurellaceae bacterium RH1A]|nr:hypothetical protein A4G20_07250 [Pasteurellaceae bacterium RH1A]
MGLLSFLQKKLPIDTTQIEQAIAKLEQASSAELRVVVERKSKTDQAMERATEVFNALKMYETADRNAVLIYLSFKPHHLAIIGDKGIHQKVAPDFWQKIYDAMKQDCQAACFTQAICRGIEAVQVELAHHFPRKENDQNELPNEVIIK